MVKFEVAYSNKCFQKKIFLSIFFNLLLSGNTPTPKLYGNTDCDIQIELYNKLTFDISSFRREKKLGVKMNIYRSENKLR